MKIGLSYSALKIDENILREYQVAGIECIEVCCSYKDQFEEIDFKKIKKLCDAYGIHIWSFHLSFFPFEELDIASFDENIRNTTIEFFKKQMTAAASIGIDKFIIHPSAEPYLDDEREEHIRIASLSLKRLSEVAQNLGGVLCVENLPRTCLSRCSDDMLKLISQDENIMVCFDTNHLLIEDPLEFIHKLSDRIVTLHISDYDFINERHWLPGEGKLDFYKIYDTLVQIGYAGVWMYEVSPYEIQNETIQRTRPLNIKDFYINAQEIFNHLPITVCGTPTV